MSLEKQQHDHRYLLGCAQRLLGVPARAVTFAWEIEERLKKRLRFVASTGLDAAEPLVEIGMSRSGLDVNAGLEQFRLEETDPTIALVRVTSGDCEYGCCARYNFWVVAKADFQRLFHHVRCRNRRATRQSPPIMTDEQRARLWNNTIGFLNQSVGVLRKYGVAQRRGVLLIGEPGNGKTMAARWLRTQCRRNRLAWRTVSADEYQNAVGDRAFRTLFCLRRPGIIQFDDLDQHMRDRTQVGATSGHAALLTELDGVEPRQGVVYLFTSNASLNQLDPAIRRPGRIDQIIEFPRPNADMRGRLVHKVWHADLLSETDGATIVRQTEGLSFAELDELKKLMVMGFLDTGRWDWSHAWQTFQAGRQSVTRPIGFQQAELLTRRGEASLDISASDGMNRI